MQGIHHKKKLLKGGVLVRGLSFIHYTFNKFSYKTELTKSGQAMA